MSKTSSFRDAKQVIDRPNRHEFHGSQPRSEYTVTRRYWSGPNTTSRWPVPRYYLLMLVKLELRMIDPASDRDCRGTLRGHNGTQQPRRRPTVSLLEAAIADGKSRESATLQPIEMSTLGRRDTSPRLSSLSSKCEVSEYDCIGLVSEDSGPSRRVHRRLLPRKPTASYYRLGWLR